jgi:hypothetical protein
MCFNTTITPKVTEVLASPVIDRALASTSHPAPWEGYGTSNANWVMAFRKAQGVSISERATVSETSIAAMRPLQKPLLLLADLHVRSQILVQI